MNKKEVELIMGLARRFRYAPDEDYDLAYTQLQAAVYGVYDADAQRLEEEILELKDSLYEKTTMISVLYETVQTLQGQLFGKRDEL